MKILVCGGRYYGTKIDPTGMHIPDDEALDFLFNTLEDYYLKYPNLTIIQGGAKGADSLAKRWAEHRNVPCITFAAEWARYGISAGTIRNAKMLEESKPDLVVAFKGKAGTKDMISRAIKKGVPVDNYG